MQQARAIAATTLAYLKHHPEELGRAFRNAAALRFGVPLDAIRWLVLNLGGKKTPKDLELESVPPGVRVSASLNLMGTPVRASTVVYVERITVDPIQLRFEIRLAEVSMKVLDEQTATPLAALLRSGALDLSKPGNLVAYMPKRPACLVEARGDRLVVDLMKLPKVSQNPQILRWIERLLPLITVTSIETDPGHLDVSLRAFPTGVRRAMNAIKSRLLPS